MRRGTAGAGIRRGHVREAAGTKAAPEKGIARKRVTARGLGRRANDRVVGRERGGRLRQPPPPNPAKVRDRISGSA